MIIFEIQDFDKKKLRAIAPKYERKRTKKDAQRAAIWITVGYTTHLAITH